MLRKPPLPSHPTLEPPAVAISFHVDNQEAVVADKSNLTDCSRGDGAFGWWSVSQDACGFEERLSHTQRLHNAFPEKAPGVGRAAPVGVWVRIRLGGFGFSSPVSPPFAGLPTSPAACPLVERLVLSFVCLCVYRSVCSCDGHLKLHPFQDELLPHLGDVHKRLSDFLPRRWPSFLLKLYGACRWPGR